MAERICPMTKYTFTITPDDVGNTIGPPGGYLTDLVMYRGSSQYEMPRFHPSGHFRGGYLTLRGSLDFRDLVNFSPQSGQYGCIHNPIGVREPGLQRSEGVACRHG
jgi:hypothetical protein